MLMKQECESYAEYEWLHSNRKGKECSRKVMSTWTGVTGCKYGECEANEGCAWEGTNPTVAPVDNCASRESDWVSNVDDRNSYVCKQWTVSSSKFHCSKFKDCIWHSESNEC